jgi:hypothetical protein
MRRYGSSCLRTFSPMSKIWSLTVASTTSNVSSHFVAPLFVSFRFVSFRFVSFRFVSFRFVSFRFVSFRFVSSDVCVSVPNTTFDIAAAIVKRRLQNSFDRFISSASFLRWIRDEMARGSLNIFQSREVFTRSQSFERRSSNSSPGRHSNLAASLGRSPNSRLSNSGDSFSMFNKEVNLKKLYRDLENSRSLGGAESISSFTL